MSLGAFFDKIIWLAFGIYLIYLSKAKTEKLGNKAALMRFIGMAAVAYAVIATLVSVFLMG